MDLMRSTFNSATLLVFDRYLEFYSCFSRKDNDFYEL
jgi:hypothetical protein